VVEVVEPAQGEAPLVEGRGKEPDRERTKDGGQDNEIRNIANLLSCVL
jgi:hypothetical protein